MSTAGPPSRPQDPSPCPALPRAPHIADAELAQHHPLPHLVGAPPARHLPGAGQKRRVASLPLPFPFLFLFFPLPSPPAAAHKMAPPPSRESRVRAAPPPPAPHSSGHGGPGNGDRAGKRALGHRQGRCRRVGRLRGQHAGGYREGEEGRGGRGAGLTPCGPGSASGRRLRRDRHGEHGRHVGLQLRGHGGDAPAHEGGGGGRRRGGGSRRGGRRVPGRQGAAGAARPAGR